MLVVSLPLLKLRSDPMWIDYAKVIEESPEELLAAEKRLRGSPLQSRARMLRLLKTEAYQSRRELAGALGYSRRQLGRWWKAYQKGGLDALLSRKPLGGSTERVSEEAWAALCEKMKRGEIARLEEARQFLAEEHGVCYRSVSAVSRLFKRRRVKLKTGRPRHGKASSEEQAAFKK